MDVQTDGECYFRADGFSVTVITRIKWDQLRLQIIVGQWIRRLPMNSWWSEALVWSNEKIELENLMSCYGKRRNVRGFSC